MNPNNLINIQGQKFGRWTVLEKIKVEGKKKHIGFVAVIVE